MITFFQWIRDLLEIYTWKELWIVFSVPTIMVGVWTLFSFSLSIKSDVIRAVTIWSLIFVLTLGAATTEALRKRQK